MNPHALDVPNDGVDADCEGGDATELDPPCDEDGEATSADPEEGAEALGLCRWVSQKSRNWGVIEASFFAFFSLPTQNINMPSGALDRAKILLSICRYFT